MRTKQEVARIMNMADAAARGYESKYPNKTEKQVDEFFDESLAFLIGVFKLTRSDIVNGYEEIHAREKAEAETLGTL